MNRPVPTVQEHARFVTGSLLRHVVVMASTSAVGLIAVFAVDLMNLFYLSLLGEVQIAAAVGFAGTVGFLLTAICIGMTIGVGAVVSRAIGAGEEHDARRAATTGLIAMIVLSALIALATVLAVDPLLDMLGGAGETRALASTYIVITVPSLPLLGAGMCLSALLRSVGDARRAMNVTLFAALLAAACDPLLIFGLRLDLTGAAITTVISRAALLALGWHGAVVRHGMLGRLEPRHAWRDLRRIAGIAIPAIATNIATPMGTAYVTRSMALFGPDAMAGQATIDRISPVAFGLIYALSGAIGPIIAQNLGAGQVERVRLAVRDSLFVVVATVGFAWIVLAACQNFIVAAFSVHGTSEEMVRLFCDWLAASFLFTGSLFVANAAFNNLGYALLSTLFNWGRATLGTIPFVGAGMGYGPRGVLIGQAAGSLLFGLGAVCTVFYVIRRLHPSRQPVTELTVAMAPGSTGGTALASYAARPRGWLRGGWHRRSA